jgi:hypothetical protein
MPRACTPNSIAVGDHMRGLTLHQDIVSWNDWLFKAFFFWGGKTHCALIATPNVDNANRRQKKGKS